MSVRAVMGTGYQAIMEVTVVNEQPRRQARRWLCLSCLDTRVSTAPWGPLIHIIPTPVASYSCSASACISEESRRSPDNHCHGTNYFQRGTQARCFNLPLSASYQNQLLLSIPTCAVVAPDTDTGIQRGLEVCKIQAASTNEPEVR